MPIYTDALEVEEIADSLIGMHHPHLEGEPIRYLFRDKAPSKNGRVVLGTASLVSGRQAYFALDEEERAEELRRQEKLALFVIEIAIDTWNDLTERQKVALVDHELCHCYAEDEIVDEGKDSEREIRKLSIVAHDLEEFRGIVQRHGLWKDDLILFAKDLKVALHQAETEEMQARTQTVKAGKGK